MKSINILLATLFIVNVCAITFVPEVQNKKLSVTITLDSGRSLLYKLKENNVKSNNYRVMLNDQEYLPTFDHICYSGHLQGDKKSSIYLTYSNMTYSGYLEFDDKEYQLMYNHLNGDYVIGEIKNNLTTEFKIDTTPVDEKFKLLPNTSDIEYLLSSTKYIELIVVNDADRLASAGGDVNKVLKSTESIMNIVSTLYRNANFDPKIEVVLVGQVVWQTNPITPTEVSAGLYDASNYLSLWHTWRNANLNKLPFFDNGVLLTGKKFASGTLGIATKSSMCASRSGSVNTARFESGVTDIYLGDITTHEIAHNLGFNHDPGTTECPSRGFILQSAVSRSRPVYDFTPCSYRDYATFMAKYNANPSIQCMENPVNSLPTISPTPIPTITVLPTSTPVHTVLPTTTPVPTVKPTNPPITIAPTPNPSVTPSPTTQPRSDARCGPLYNNAGCRYNNCCSKWNFCGISPDHCLVSRGCQFNCRS